MKGLTPLNRIAFWFSIVMVVVTLFRLADADWANFREHSHYHLFVLAWLATATYSLRTVGTREIVRFWLMGFFPVVLVAYLVTEFLESQLGSRNLQTGVLVPLLEESIKFLPLVLWTTVLRPKHRHGTLSDFLLLGFVTGAGFSFHEDALYSRVAASGFDDGFFGNLFPIFLSSGQFAITHAGWTALAGVGVGLISLHRHRPLVRLGGLALLVVPIVDHAAINWSGDGSDFMHAVSRDGHLAAWILAVVVVGVVAHDSASLRWATQRDGSFPVPAVTGDLRVLGAAPPARRLAGLLDRQRYRRRRNATFIDLFAIRSTGVSAGDRSRVRRELEVDRDRVGDPMPAVAASTRRPVTTTAALAAPSRPAKSGAKGPKLVLGLMAVAAVLALVWWMNGSDGEDLLVASVDEPPASAPAPDPASGSIDPSSDDPAGLELSFGPTINEPLLLRWEVTTQRGASADQLLVVDGQRELRIQGGVLQYQEGEISVFCVAWDTEDIGCSAQERTGSLADMGWLGLTINAGIPGATLESRRIAGRDATCLLAHAQEDTTSLSCTDDETQVQLLNEYESVDIIGSRVYSRVELVEWGKPQESDFAIPAAVREALVASGE